MSATPDISVVIPAFNRPGSLLSLLDSLQGQVGIEFETIVVDDCSTDDPTRQIVARFPHTIVLRNETNRGPAVSRNRGIRASRGRIVVGLDSDVTVPDASVLRRVAAEFNRADAPEGLAFRLLLPDGKTDDAARWWHPVPLAGFAQKSFATSYFSGTGYAFRRDALLEAGLFPEILFMHYEEVELAYRLLDRGGRIRYCPDIAVLHHAHPVSRRSEILKFYKPRNQVLLAIGCLPLLRALGYVTPRLAFHFLAAVRNGHLSSFWRALRSAAEKTPARWKQRRVLQRSTFRRLTALRDGLAT